MRRALFAVWLLWILAMALIFAPVLIVLAVAQGVLIVMSAAFAHVFHALTSGTFK